MSYLRCSPTTKIVDGFGTQLRVWRGRTDNGEECFLLVARMIVKPEDEDQVQRDFGLEIRPVLPGTHFAALQDASGLQQG